MATLHLMVGLPGSGKTTEAIRLEKACRALRLTTDEWHYQLFGNDFRKDGRNREHDRRHAAIEALMWDTARKVLALGVDVILDFGCWAREERELLRQRAHAVGADFRIHYMACSQEVLWERLRERNRNVGREAVFYITKQQLEEWSRRFEPPGPEELAQQENEAAGERGACAGAAPERSGRK